MATQTNGYRAATALLSLALTASFSTSVSAQQASNWWPQSGANVADQPAAQPPAGQQPAYGAVPAPPAMPAAQPAAAPQAAGEADGSWMVTSPFANVRWPEIKMPKVEWKPFWSGEPQPGGAASESAGMNPLSKVKSMTTGMAQKTKAAWNKTIDRFKLTGSDKPTQASEPGFFARMFGSGDQPAGPQTVPQFLAQERPGMSAR